MKLGDAAKVLKVDQVLQKVQPYKPFSTLRSPNAESFLADVVRPKLANPGYSIQDVSPVTDSQALDIRATIQAPRTSVQYTMLFFSEKINRERLLQACRNLVQAHDILRTVFIEHEGAFLQVVLKELDASLITQVS